MNKPYKDRLLKLTKDVKIFIRIFNNINIEDMVWHRDSFHRKVELIEGKAILYLDNQIPIDMKLNVIYEIPKEVFHKAHPLTDYLEIKITEIL